MKNILSRISMLFLAILVSSMLWVSPAIGGDSWTLIFYLAADNEQEAYADITIDQLLTGTAEVTNHPQILVFIDRLSTEGTEVFEVLNGAKVPLPGQGEQNSASGDVLQDFATDALNLAEHDKVAFIIKSEGLSWRGIGRDNTQGIGVPDQLMSTGDLAEALSNAQNSNNNNTIK